MDAINKHCGLPGSCEQDAELVGLLTAISIVSRRLAGRLAALGQPTDMTAASKAKQPKAHRRGKRGGRNG